LIWVIFLLESIDMTDAPKRDERILGHQGYGLIQVVHGDGKGKTTSCLGTAIRCAGAGKRVAIVYFDKGGGHYSERIILDSIPNITYWVTGRDRIDPVTGRFDFSITDVDRAEASRGLACARQALAGAFDLVVLDEINSTTQLGMLAEEDVLRVLAEKSPQTEVTLSGRNPPQSFLDAAHLISRVSNERHYFYSGVRAREGIDF